MAWLNCNTSGVRVALRFSNCNNDLIDGPGCLNLNNEASNANWNNGVGVYFLLGTSMVKYYLAMGSAFLHHWLLKYR